jgi:hypothetical protein
MIPMARTDDDRLAQIRKLLDRAQHPGTPEGEALACEEKAEALLARYGYERAMLPETERKAEKMEVRVFWIDNPYGRDKVTLLYSIAYAFGCQHVFFRLDGGFRVRVFGYESDLDRVELLYTSLQLQAVAGMRRAELPHWETSRARFNRSWLHAFAITVGRRLKKAQQRAGREFEGTGAELVLRDRAQDVETFFQQHAGRTRKVKPKRSTTGWEAGSEAGRSADLSQTRLGGERVALGR